MSSGVFALALVVSLGVFVFLYVLIRGETTSTTVTDRADAERAAREFGHRRDEPSRRNR